MNWVEEGLWIWNLGGNAMTKPEKATQRTVYVTDAEYAQANR